MAACVKNDGLCLANMLGKAIWMGADEFLVGNVSRTGTQFCMTIVIGTIGLSWREGSRIFRVSWRCMVCSWSVGRRTSRGRNGYIRDTIVRMVHCDNEYYISRHGPTRLRLLLTPKTYLETAGDQRCYPSRDRVHGFFYHFSLSVHFTRPHHSAVF